MLLQSVLLPEKVLQGEPEDANGLDQVQHRVVDRISIDVLKYMQYFSPLSTYPTKSEIYLHQTGQSFCIDQTFYHLQWSFYGTLDWTEGRVLRIIPTVETTTKMNEMKETALKFKNII